MSLSVEVKGYNELMVKLNTVQNIIKRLAPTMLKVALQVEMDAKEFITGRHPLDKSQVEAARLSAATKVGEQGLGVETGRLKGSIKGIIEEITNDYVTATVSSVGNVVYARIHELGGTIENAFGRGIQVEMPARPYLFAALIKNKKFIEDTFQDAINKIIKE